MGSDNLDYFDYKTEDEIPEEPAKLMRKCPHCDKPIPADSLFCLYCGESVSPAKKNALMAIVAIFVLIAFLFWIFIR